MPGSTAPAPVIDREKLYRITRYMLLDIELARLEEMTDEHAPRIAPDGEAVVTIYAMVAVHAASGQEQLVPLAAPDLAAAFAKAIAIQARSGSGIARATAADLRAIERG